MIKPWMSALFAAFGGFISMIAGKPKEAKYSLLIAIPEVIIAIFAGLLMHYICIEMQMSDNVAIIFVAIAGYSARIVLEIFNAAAVRWLKDAVKNLKPQNKDNNNDDAH